MKRGFLIILLTVPPWGTGIAAADKDEWRYSLAATGSIASLDQADASASSLAGGGRLRIAFGLTNTIEVAGVLGFSKAGDVEWQNAFRNPQRANLFANVYASEGAIEARLVGGAELSRAFASTHPLVGLRGGLLVRVVADSIFLDGMQRELPPRPDADTSLLPFVAAELGVEHRFNHWFVVGLVGDFTYAGSSYQAAGLSLELGWLRY